MFFSYKDSPSPHNLWNDTNHIIRLNANSQKGIEEGVRVLILQVYYYCFAKVETKNASAHGNVRS